MKKLIITTIATFALTASAHASQCLTDMSKIDASLPTAKVTKTVKTAVMELRAEGKKLHDAGANQQCVQKLAEAKVLLGIK